MAHGPLVFNEVDVEIDVDAWQYESSPNTPLICICGRKGLQIWQSWPLSVEGSIACRTYCDTGHSFIMVISEDL